MLGWLKTAGSAFVKLMLSSRVKSLAWRTAAMLAIGLLTVLADNLELFRLTVEQATFAGLVLGEITKWLNKKYQLKKGLKKSSV